MCFAPQRRALLRHLNLQKWAEPLVFLTFWLRNVLRATMACTFSYFFDISTSKSGPNVVCFVHFDFEMCFAPQRRALFRHLNFQKWSGAGVFCTFWLRNVFAPQRRALFRHLNFQKWSEPGVLCTFWLGNVLRATTACNFSSLIWPLAPHPPLWRACFSTLRSHKSLEKHSVSRLSYLFAHLHLLSSDSFSSTLLSSNLSLLSDPISAFHLSILSEVWLLNFLRPMPPKDTVVQWKLALLLSQI